MMMKTGESQLCNLDLVLRGLFWLDACTVRVAEMSND